MDIALYDKGGGLFVKWARDAVIKLTEEGSIAGAKVRPYNRFDKIGSIEEVCRMDIVIAHIRLADWETLLEKSPSGSVRIRVSTAGFTSKPRPRRSPQGVIVLHLLQPTGELKTEDWERIIGGLSERARCEALLEEKDLDGLHRYFRPETKEFLPTLAILCQGYLAVHAQQSEDGWQPRAIARALSQMGYTSEVHQRLQANVEAKKSAVTDPEWWVLPKTNSGDLMRRAQKEWDPSDDDRGWEKFRMLLNRIDENNSPLDTARDRKLVATAYCALADRLGGIPCG